MAYLENIRVFVRVYQLGNLSVTARDMRLSPAVVSNRIKELEKYLKIRLFNRTTRQIVPTRQGEVFYHGAVKILEAVDEAESSVAQLTNQLQGSIRIAAPLSMGRKIISPCIPEFHDRYPNIQVRVQLTNRNIEFMRDGIDVAFQLGVFEDSSFRMRGIMDCERVLCASPGYIKKMGMLATPDDLTSGGHHCLLLRFAGSKEYFWRLLVNGSYKKFQVKGPYDCDDSDVLTEWALNDRGIINRPLFEIRHHILEGSLVPVLESHPPEPAKLAAVYPHKQFQDPKIRLLVDFMAERCKRAVNELMQ